MDYLPLFFQLRSQAVAVVGGGRVAVRKVDLLRRSGARVTVIAPSLREELQKLASSGEIQHIAASFAPEQLDQPGLEAMLVIAATDNHEVNEAVSAAARCSANN